MSYDEPTEPTDEEIEAHETEQALLKSPSVRIEGLTRDDVDATLRAMLRRDYQAEARYRELLEEHVSTAVAELIGEVSRERVEKAIDATIAEGFAEYDSYSGRELRRVSLRQLVDKSLTFKSDDYHFRGQSIGQMAVTKAVTEIFEKELKPLLEELKVDLRKQADGVFQAKIVASLREALGLK